MTSARHARVVVITTLGFGQILGWGSSYYLPAVLAKPILADTGWSLAWIITGLTIGSLTAGLIAHRVGNAIQARGGRPVMIAGTFILALGLIALGLAPNLPLHLVAWLLIGVGMGCSLYDAAFSMLGKLYGAEARRAITTLTLFGGFASTICWPLSAVFLEWLGWRGACFAYAALHLMVMLPLYGLVLPSSKIGDVEIASSSPEHSESRETQVADRQWLLFGLLASAIGLSWAISSVLSVHLLTIMQSRGMELAAAVALGALVGPSQVAGRAIEMAFGSHYRPIWTLLISVGLVALGLGLLAIDIPTISAALICYGAGAGIASIARGTLPLAIFGPERYAIWVGRLAGPTLVAGAVSPALAALLLDKAGASVTLYVLEGFALVNIGIALVLWWAVTRHTLQPTN